MNPLFTATRQYSPVALLLLSLSALTILSGCSKPESKVTEADIYHQSAQLLNVTPEQGYQINHQYIGKISAKQQANLSFEYSGKVNNVLIDSGDRVIKGQVLAKQNTQVLTFQKSELLAQITQANAQIKLNKSNLARVNTLINNGYASQQKLDELNAENEVLQAKISGLKARINTLDYQISKAQLIAPFSAVIGQRMLSEGEVAAAGTPVFQLIEQNNDEIIVGIPNTLATNLSLGDTLNVRLNDKKEQAKIVAIGQQVDAVSRTVELRLTLLNDDQERAANFNNQIVRVTIASTIKKAGFWIPIDAITDGIRGQWQIYLALPQSMQDAQNQPLFKIQTATVNILHSNENRVFITGLSLKQHQLVAHGLHRLVGGQLIKESDVADLSANISTMKTSVTKIMTGANK